MTDTYTITWTRDNETHRTNTERSYQNVIALKNVEIAKLKREIQRLKVRYLGIKVNEKNK